MRFSKKKVAFSNLLQKDLKLKKKNIFPRENFTKQSHLEQLSQKKTTIYFFLQMTTVFVFVHRGTSVPRAWICELRTDKESTYVGVTVVPR